MNSRYREHLSVDNLVSEPSTAATGYRIASSHKEVPNTKQTVGFFHHVKGLLTLILLSFIALQFYFLTRIVMMNWFNPESTSFQRSEAVRIIRTEGGLTWRQQWVNYEDISNNVKRAVITSEDAEFTEHSGVDWKALEAAAERNARAQERAEKRLERLAARQSKKPDAKKPIAPPVKIVGGSTITQQLAKNLFLSGERNLVRKGQEVIITFMMEAFLSKRRILEIYLNNVEWGAGIFGVEAAAQFYFKKPASQLSRFESARLAVMLPRPRFYQKKPRSAYLTQRAGRIAAQLNRVQLP